MVHLRTPFSGRTFPSRRTCVVPVERGLDSERKLSGFESQGLPPAWLRPQHPLCGASVCSSAERGWRLQVREDGAFPLPPSLPGGVDVCG